LRSIITTGSPVKISIFLLGVRAPSGYRCGGHGPINALVLVANFKFHPGCDEEVLVGKTDRLTLSAPVSAWTRVRAALPSGDTLPQVWWDRRHRWMVRVLMVLSFEVALFSYVVASRGPVYALLFGLAPAAFAAVAEKARLGRRVRSAAASLGLLTCAAMLVHATGGLPEMYYSFFILIGLLTLYEDWVPFGLAVGFVLVHHAVVGVIDPSAGYAHSEAPWKWAAIHAGFAAAAGAVGIATWRHNEELRQQKEESEAELRRRQEDVLAVSRLAADLANQADARSQICEAVLDLTDAAFAMLWELDAEGNLLSTATAGIKLPPDSKIMVGTEPSVAALAVLEKKRHFVGDVAAEPAVPGVIRDTGARSMVYEPVMRGERTVGVLVAAWDDQVEIESSRDASLILLLASEAAFAIDRSDLLERLNHLARNDHLTGLPNRRAWEERLRRELRVAKRQDTPLCVALLDLDRFKIVNDTRGHQAGDRLLRSVAAAWTAVMRDTDFLGRLGGDEFGLILPRCDFDEAMEILERVEQTLPEIPWSAGLATCDRDEELGELMRRADAALYRAKAAGRSHTTVAHG
jgi:diguanylate cyclase (GGDEF)-like protein